MIYVRKIILAMLGVFACMIYTQAQDTVQISYYDLADSLYGELSESNIPSGRLLNRTLIHIDSIRSGVYSGNSKRPITADDMHAMLVEKKQMSLDSSEVPHQLNVYIQATQEALKDEHLDLGKTIVPFGIHQYEFQYMNENSPFISKNNSQFFDDGINASSAFKTYNAITIGPLIDFQSDDVLYFSLPEEFRFIDDTIKSIKILDEGIWEDWNIDELYEYYIDADSVQTIRFRVEFNHLKPVDRIVQLRTPGAKIQEKRIRPDWCDVGGQIDDGGGRTIDWCVLKGCDNDLLGDKPYLIISGYRPPIFGRSFSSQREQYTEGHGHLIEDLRSQGFDVYLVRFDYHTKPLSHGTRESAYLLKRLLREYVNPGKYGSNHETIIQAASFAEDVCRIALMEMEHENFNGTHTYEGSHHHTRLLISVDAQFHGANVPLATQYLVMSSAVHYSPMDLALNGSLFGAAQMTLNSFMYLASLGKSALETLRYSGWAGHAGDNFPWSPWGQLNIDASHHPKRAAVLTRLNELKYNWQHVPMPLGPRHIAVSMGKLHTENFVGTGGYMPYPAPGSLVYEYDGKWGRAAQHSNDHFPIFGRTSLFGGSGLLIGLNQSMSVRNMHRIDGTSGSYHIGMGNMSNIYNTANLGLPAFIPGVPLRYCHKSTVSGLAIHEDHFDYKHHVDIHDLELMRRLRNNDLFQSEFYGYPNIGRPDDHFDYTPFEAIYVDDRPQPHIDLSEFEVDSLRHFYASEIQPWYLVLQNDELGGQVDSEYIYKSKRIAKHAILLSRNRSPKTDKGPYIIKKNAKLWLRAGDFIEVDPFEAEPNQLIFDTEDGGFLDAQIKPFDDCSDSKTDITDYTGDKVTREKIKYEIQDDSIEEEKEKEIKRLNIYPNPHQNNCTLEAPENEYISEIEIKSMDGKLLRKIRLPELFHKFNLNTNLSSGTYLVSILTDKGTYKSQMTIL